jgi:hypothetical protein
MAALPIHGHRRGYGVPGLLEVAPGWPPVRNESLIGRSDLWAADPSPFRGRLGLMFSSVERGEYSWVDAMSGVAVASCFSFFDGLSVDEVVALAGIRDGRVARFARADAAPAPLGDGEVAIFSAAGWTVLYEPNGYPERFANSIAGSARAERSVIVFWNVNAVTEFAYWERGSRVVAFDWPQDRHGLDPDRLIAEMQATVGLERTGEEGGSVFEVYQQMLALAERITGVRLGSDFLNGRAVVVGLLDDDDASAATTGEIDPPGPPADAPERVPAEPDTAIEGPWTPEERRSNKQALEAIPKDRWPELPARLARLACERVGIANRFPVDDILEALDNNLRPSPARLTSREDLWACVEDVTFSGLDRPSPEQVMGAIEAVFTAARPSSRRAPLGVLRHARIAVNDQDTQMIDEVSADMGVSGSSES